MWGSYQAVRRHVPRTACYPRAAAIARWLSRMARAVLHRASRYHISTMSKNSANCPDCRIRQRRCVVPMRCPHAQGNTRKSLQHNQNAKVIRNFCELLIKITAKVRSKHRASSARALCANRKGCVPERWGAGFYDAEKRYRVMNSGYVSTVLNTRAASLQRGRAPAPILPSVRFSFVRRRSASRPAGAIYAPDHFLRYRKSPYGRLNT
jgi:hypothetical protein